MELGSFSAVFNPRWFTVVEAGLKGFIRPARLALSCGDRSLRGPKDSFDCCDQPRRMHDAENTCTDYHESDYYHYCCYSLVYGRPIVYVVVVISTSGDDNDGDDVSNRYVYVGNSSSTTNASTRHYDSNDDTDDDGFAKCCRSVEGGGWEVFVGVSPRRQNDCTSCNGVRIFAGTVVKFWRGGWVSANDRLANHANVVYLVVACAFSSRASTRLSCCVCVCLWVLHVCMKRLVVRAFLYWRQREQQQERCVCVCVCVACVCVLCMHSCVCLFSLCLVIDFYIRSDSS